MQLKIRVKLNSEKQRFEKFSNQRYFVHLTSKDHKSGNDELIPVLSKNLATPPSRILIQSGFDSEDKIINLE